MISSTLLNNTANDGDVLLVTHASTAELYNTTLLSSSSSSSTLRCLGTGTMHAVMLTIEDLTDVLFDFDGNCVLFLYQINGNGTDAMRNVVQTNLIEETPASVNFVHWSWPCPSGQWSADGIEHGDITDVNGISIDINDKFCDHTVEDDAEGGCAGPCATCPPGRYLEFTLNRFLHLGEVSCNTCPPGRFLNDDGTPELHDSLDDCSPCPVGTYASAPGSGECHTCADGTYAAEEGSVACSFTNPGFFVADESSSPEACPKGTSSVGLRTGACDPCAAGTYAAEEGSIACSFVDPGYSLTSPASEPVECPAGTSSVGGTETCKECDIGEFQPERGQPSCIACPAQCRNHASISILRWTSFLFSDSLCRRSKVVIILVETNKILLFF